jgi:hypothetical protein
MKPHLRSGGYTLKQVMKGRSTQYWPECALVVVVSVSCVEGNHSDWHLRSVMKFIAQNT